MTITKMAWLGDSLSDSDEFYRLSSQVLKVPLPNAEWYSTRFTNGEVHSSIVPGLLGIEGGDAYNYAFAGGRAVGSLAGRDFVEDPSILKVDIDDPRLDTDINLTAQTDRFLADAASDDRDLAGFSVNVWIGSNDLANWEPDSIWPWRWDNEIEDLVRDVVASIETNVERLLEAGTGQVRVFTQPETTFFPAFNDAGFIVDYYSDGVVDNMNGRLERMVEEFEVTGADVRLIDMNALTTEVERDPGTFGLSQIEQSWLLGESDKYGQTVNPNLGFETSLRHYTDRIGFIDSVHPTAAMHGVMAAFEAEVYRNGLQDFGRRADDVLGSAGDDLIFSGRGHDTVTSGAGQDVVLAGKGHDAVEAGAGTDIVAGGSGNDTIQGDGGRDVLAGGYGDDSLRGGSKEDVLVDTGGQDTLKGGRGDDWILWMDTTWLGNAEDVGLDRIYGGRGQDTVVFHLADTATFDEVSREYSEQTRAGFTLETIGVHLKAVEDVLFVDLSVEDVRIPETGSTTLNARLAEADLWGFV